MAGSYTLPQVRVFQEFSNTPNDVTQNLNPFVIGPNFQLIRYSEKGERKDCSSEPYVGTEKTIEWSSSAYADTVVDQTTFGVTLVDAYVKLGDKNGVCRDATSGLGNVFEFTMSEGKSLAGGDEDELEFQVPVKAGDYLSYKDGTDTKYVKILSIESGTLTSDERHATMKNRDTKADYAKLKYDISSYYGGKNVTINIHVVAGASGADGTDAKPYGTVTWTSNVAGISGSTAKGVLKETSKLDIGKGIKLYASELLDAGDYTFSISLVEPYARDTVTVADGIAYSTTAFSFVRRFDTVEVDAEYLSANDVGVTVKAGVKTEIGSHDFTIDKATAYLTQRNLIRKHTDGVYTITSDEDIINNLGAITPENPLAYGAYVMLLNCAKAEIKYIALRGEEDEDWAYALDRASLSTDVYAFCPLTEDRDVIDKVVEHCTRMSSEEEKSWRISFFSMPTAKVIDVTPGVGDVKERCTVSSKTLTCRSATGSLTSTSSIADFRSTVTVGDTVTVVKTTGEEATTRVAAIKGPAILELEDAVPDATTALCKFWIKHERSEAEYVSAIAATSTSFRDHRAYNVFPNSLRNTDGEYVSGMFGAAAVCALACSVAPQQPITNVEIAGFSDLPDVYSTYNRAQLNEIAAGGTLILMQDRIGGLVYVRHQISTAYPDGNLNTTELSLTKNLDSISYYFANRFSPYIGRYNVTDDLLTELKGILIDGLAYLETATETSRLVGPQVLAEGTEIRSLSRSSEKDKVYADVALNLPAPFNNFDLHLNVI